MSRKSTCAISSSISFLTSAAIWIHMEMPDARILSNRLPRVESKAMRPKRLIKPAKVSATVQLTNEISRHRVSASADRYNLLRSDRRLSCSQNIFQNFAGCSFGQLFDEGHITAP